MNFIKLHEIYKPNGNYGETILAPLLVNIDYICGVEVLTGETGSFIQMRQYMRSYKVKESVEEIEQMILNKKESK